MLGMIFLFSFSNRHLMVWPQAASEDHTDFCPLAPALPWWVGVENQGKKVKLMGWGKKSPIIETKQGILIKIIIIMIVMKRRERNKTWRKQVMHSKILRHALSNAQPWAAISSSQKTSPNLYITFLRYGIPLWPVWITCPGYAPPQIFVHWQSMRLWKILNLDWALLRNNQNIAVLPLLFPS